MSRKRKKSLNLQAERMRISKSLKKAENDSTDRPEFSPPGVTSLDGSIVLPGPSTGESSGK